MKRKFDAVPRPDEAWLASWSEEIVEPDLPIIDAHHHLWDMRDWRYSAADFARDLAVGHNVVATVFIEATGKAEDGHRPALSPLQEAEIADGVARDYRGLPRLCAAIVAHADLGKGAAVESDLRRLLDVSSFVRGIRHSVARDPAVRQFAPAGLMRDPAYREGFRILQQVGMTYDAWVYHSQLEDLADLLRAFPEAPVALNHLGGRIGIGHYASAREDVDRQWRKGLLALAEFPNLHVKIGGLGMPMAGYNFHDRPSPPSSDDLSRAWRPYIEFAVETFGADRCMFESNFPVDSVSFSYSVVWNSFKKITSSLSMDERRKLFFDTSRIFYKIDTIATI